MYIADHHLFSQDNSLGFFFAICRDIGADIDVFKVTRVGTALFKLTKSPFTIVVNLLSLLIFKVLLLVICQCHLAQITWHSNLLAPLRYLLLSYCLTIFDLLLDAL